MRTTASGTRLIAVRPEDAEHLKLLGHIVFYSIPDGYLPASAVALAFQAAGIPGELVPPPARPLHRFQAACRSVEQRRSDIRDCEVKVAQIDEDEHACLYQVHFLVRDRENRLVEHPKGLRVTFEKAAGALKFEQLRGTLPAESRLHDTSLPDLGELEHRIREFHRTTADSIPGSKLRTIVRGLLSSVHAEVMRDSGGVYFVPINGAGTLANIKQALHILYPADADFAAIPVADDEEKREMIRRRLTVNTVPVIDEVLGKVTQALRTSNSTGNPVKDATVSNLFNERRRIAAVKDEYEQLLNAELTEISDKVSVLDRQLEALVNRAA